MKKTISHQARELFQKCPDTRSNIITEASITGLPEPVQRYLRYTNIIGKETIKTVKLKQKGSMRPQINLPWMPLIAEQYYTINPPAFLWFGTIKPFPFLSIVGKDQFVDGQGSMIVKLFSLIPLVDGRGANFDQGELLRYLVEMLWFPTALLSDYLQWEKLDSQSAKVTMNYSNITVSAILSFNEQNQITHLTAERYYEKGLEKWSGFCEEYREMNGIYIPTKCEVTWNLASGDFSYFRGEIIEIEYNNCRLG